MCWNPLKGISLKNNMTSLSRQADFGVLWVDSVVRQADESRRYFLS